MDFGQDAGQRTTYGSSERIAELPEGGFLFEPRSLWDIVSEPMATVDQVFRFNREFFRNPERWPMVIKRIALCGIGYTFVQQPPGVGVFWQSMGSPMNAARIAITAPFRQHYGTAPLVLNSLRPRPTWQPRPSAVGNLEPSSLYGQCNLEFDRPLILPKNGTLEWQMSAIYGPAIGNNGSGVFVYMSYHETPPLQFPGNARSFDFEAARFPVNNVYPAAGNPAAQIPQERWPFPPDAFTAGYAAAGNTNDYWDGRGNFSAGRFSRQEATAAGSTSVEAMHCMIDQIAFDEVVQAALAPASNGFQLAPMSTRIGTAVRSVSGGSGRDWWRKGAPLALVFDSITPAAVYELPYPITLRPGDCLDIEVTIPANANVVDLDDQQRLMTIGLAANGYAAIEG